MNNMKVLILLILIFGNEVLLSKSIHLKTGDETVLTKLIDADIYEKNKICIIDGLTGELLVFDYKSGIQTNSFALDFNLTDTISQYMLKNDFLERKWVTIDGLFKKQNDKMTKGKLKEWNGPEKMDNNLSSIKIIMHLIRSTIIVSTM